MGIEISDDDFDAVGFYKFDKISEINGLSVVACEDRSLNLPIDILRSDMQVRSLSQREIKPMMSGGMKVKVEATFEDKHGNKIGGSLTVEKEKESSSSDKENQAPDFDNKPDSRDRDFDRDS